MTYISVKDTKYCHQLKISNFFLEGDESNSQTLLVAKKKKTDGQLSMLVKINHEPCCGIFFLLLLLAADFIVMRQLTKLTCEL